MEILISSGNLFEYVTILEKHILEDEETMLRFAFLKALSQHSDYLQIGKEIAFTFPYQNKMQTTYRRKKELEPLILVGGYFEDDRK